MDETGNGTAPVELAYGDVRRDTGEMEWVVRAVGWGLALVFGLQLAGGQVAWVTRNAALRPGSAWREMALHALVAGAGAALVARWRVGFWVLLAAIAGWVLVPHGWTLLYWIQWLPRYLPQGMLYGVLVVVLYQRAQCRGALQPPGLAEPERAAAGEDVAWLTRAIGWCFVGEAVYRCNMAVLGFVLQNQDPLEGQPGDLWVAGRTAGAVLLVLGWRSALIGIAALLLAQTVTIVPMLMRVPWPRAGGAAGGMAGQLVVVAMLGMVYWKGRMLPAPACPSARPGLRKGLIVGACAAAVYATAVYAAVNRITVRRLLTGEREAQVDATIKRDRADRAIVSLVFRNNTDEVLRVDLREAEIVVVEGETRRVDPYMNSHGRGWGSMHVDPGRQFGLEFAVPISAEDVPRRVEIRGARYRLGNGSPTTLPVGW